MNMKQIKKCQNVENPFFFICRIMTFKFRCFCLVLPLLKLPFLGLEVFLPVYLIVFFFFLIIEKLSQFSFLGGL